MKKKYLKPSLEAHNVEAMSILTGSDSTGQIPITDKPYPSKSKYIDISEDNASDDEW